MNTTNSHKANREHKSTLFVKLFGENKVNALSLYNAVDECVADGVLEDFLSRHRKEVRNMVLTEFDEEKFLKMVREEERAEGRIEGRIETLAGLLCDLGEVPPQIIDRAKVLDTDTFKEWAKAAARAESMEEFLESIRVCESFSVN